MLSQLIYVQFIYYQSYLDNYLKSVNKNIIYIIFNNIFSINKQRKQFHVIIISISVTILYIN